MNGTANEILVFTGSHAGKSANSTRPSGLAFSHSFAAEDAWIMTKHHIRRGWLFPKQFNAEICSESGNERRRNYHPLPPKYDQHAGRREGSTMRRCQV